jgi:hypothetical protein
MLAIMLGGIQPPGPYISTPDRSSDPRITDPTNSKASESLSSASYGHFFNNLLGVTVADARRPAVNSASGPAMCHRLRDTGGKIP